MYSPQNPERRKEGNFAISSPRTDQMRKDSHDFPTGGVRYCGNPRLLPGSGLLRFLCCVDDAPLHGRDDPSHPPHSSATFSASYLSEISRVRPPIRRL